FEAIHRGKPDQKLLAYQYLQVLPQLARGDANKMWIIPSELTEALKGIGSALGGKDTDDPSERWVDTGEVMPTAFEETMLEDPAKALAEARGQAAGATAEAESHATASERRAQRSGRPAADSLEDQASALHDSELNVDKGPGSSGGSGGQGS
ncbi:MAG: SPFH/Band 7/PHB domain protein, partial [Dermatophilaceae bacterium]